MLLKLSRTFFISIIALTFGCSSSKTTQTSEVVASFPGENMRGCFLLYNMKTKTFEKKLGDSCEERYPACSTFKVPLAIIAFETKTLKNEKQVLKWDGNKRMLDVWNQDHNAESWMKNSVVWFSQKITPKIGEKRLTADLKKMNFGNADLSSGLTDAWLHSVVEKDALKITAYEQVNFIEKLFQNKLPFSTRSQELTRKITYLETSPKGFNLHGKTGSNNYDKEKRTQFGWFVAHVSDGNQEYIAVTQISDTKPLAEVTSFGGLRAKELTKKLLTESGLW